MPLPVATLANPTLHGPPTLGPPVPTVLMCKKPTWTVATAHTCPMMNVFPPPAPPTPHVSGMTMPPGGIKTLVGKKPLARATDIILEPAAIIPLPPPNTILPAPNTVLG